MTDIDLERMLETVGQRIDGVEREMAKTFSSVNLRFNDTEEMIEASLKPITPDRTELYKALIAAQLEIKNADQNVDNEFLKSKYADLASVMDAVREPLAKNGLAIFQLTATVKEVQTVTQDNGAIGIKTTLAHESGQTIVDITALVPPKMDPQGIGSCRTYMRRYAVLAICAIAGAIDDDAEGAKKDPEDYERITTAEAEKILIKADELFADRADAAVKKMLDRVFGGLTRIADIRAGEAEVAITNLQNAKQLMDKAAKKRADKTSPKPPTTEGKAEPGADG